MAALDQIITEAGGDISDPAVEEAFNQFFDENQANLKDKVENYCWLIKEIDSRSLARKAEAERLRRRAMIDTHSVSALKNRLRDALQSADINEVQTENHKVWVQRSGGKRALILNQEAIPPEYITMRELREPNKELIRQKLEDGIELPFASFAERGYGLRMG